MEDRAPTRILATAIPDVFCMHFIMFAAPEVSCSCSHAHVTLTHRCRVRCENGRAVDHAVCECM